MKLFVVYKTVGDNIGWFETEVVGAYTKRKAAEKRLERVKAEVVDWNAVTGIDEVEVDS